MVGCGTTYPYLLNDSLIIGPQIGKYVLPSHPYLKVETEEKLL